MNFRGIISLYSPTLTASVMSELRARRYSGWRLLWWFWHAEDYRLRRPLNDIERSAAVLLGLAMLAEIAVGIGFLVEWARYGSAGAWEFGAALLLGYPLVWSHAVVIAAWIGNFVWAVLHPKKAGRSLVCTVLEWQVRQLRARHKFTVIAVAGSVGKTSTKLAIADLLGQTLRVRHQIGNYNDRVTVPLVFFGLQEPRLFNILAWFKVLGASQSEIALSYPYDVVVVELGTDGPGQMEEFAYIKPDITVLTAVSPEHMEFFGTLDAVAREELRVFEYSKRVLINGDDIAGTYLAGLDFLEYSLESEQADYRATAKPQGLDGQTLVMQLAGTEVNAETRYIGRQGAKTALAAAAAAEMIGLKKQAIAKGLSELQAFSGRMQILDGIKDSKLIDDTYNASPIAVKAALDVLYAAKSRQRIAILGSMNELGGYAREAHHEVGSYCDPKKLAVIVTIGADAKKWLAPAARERGCTVHCFMNPYEAGEYVSGKMEKGAVVLAKGSQNGVFAEEAIKPLLANPADNAKLVRQSPSWQKRKAKLFPS